MRKRITRGEPSGSPNRWLGRVFWLALLLSHALAVPAATRTLAVSADIGVLAFAVLRFVGLAASLAMFALKVADVPWLRIAPGWRSAVPAVLVIALLHVGVVDRAVHGDLLMDPAHAGLVFFAGSAWSLAVVRRHLAGRASRLVRRAWRPLTPLALGRLARAEIISPIQTFVSRVSVPRAPPVVG